MTKAKSDKSERRRKLIEGSGLRTPFAKWRKEPDLAQPLRRYVDHPWLHRPARVAEFLEGDIPEPDVTWYFELEPEQTDLNTLIKRTYVPWTASQEETIFLRYNFYRWRATLAVRRLRAQGQKAASYLEPEVRDWEAKALHLRGVVAAQNLGLVLSMYARKIRHPGDIDTDTVSEGNMALLRAVDLFNVAYGFKFSTYACRAVIKALVRDRQRKQRISQLEGASYSPEDHAHQLMRPGYEDPEGLSHDQDSYLMERLRAALKTNAANLTEIEQIIICERMGFGDILGRGKPLVAVGEKLSLTKERVRQIQNAALLKLRSVVEDADMRRAKADKEDE